MARHTRARIDLSALRHNYAQARQRAGNARAMAVVKADGYGHGLEQVAGALRDEAPRFAVACLEEAERLREAGLEHPVVLLQGFHDDGDVAICERLGLEPVLHSAHQLDAIEKAGGSQLTAWLKVNTGMNRLGFRPSDIEAQVRRIRGLAGVTLKGMATHYACADDPDDPKTDEQNALFADLARRYPELEFTAANSAAHFRDDAPKFDWTRPGIMLYGATPMIAATAEDLGLQAVMTLESRLTAVRTVQPGETVGYGGAWRADKPTLMGIVSIGYGDGYPRHAPTGTPVWVAGARATTLGRVSMDMLAVDLSTAPHARPGDAVELWGRHIPVDEVARRSDTIGYELLTGVTARVPRIYQDQADVSAV